MKTLGQGLVGAIVGIIILWLLILMGYLAGLFITWEFSPFEIQNPELARFMTLCFGLTGFFMVMIGDSKSNYHGYK